MEGQLRQWGEDEQAAGAESASAWQEFFAAQGSPERAQEVQASAPIVEVQRRHEDRLLRLDNVVGVATSLKVTGGQPTNTWSLTVLVEKKLPLSEVPEESQVPGELDGVPTDVVEVGRPEPLVFNTKVRPALPGFSIGHHNITAGTFGCLVRDIRPQSSGDYLILSNPHHGHVGWRRLREPADELPGPGRRRAAVCRLGGHHDLQPHLRRGGRAGRSAGHRHPLRIARAGR